MLHILLLMLHIWQKEKVHFILFLSQPLLVIYILWAELSNYELYYINGRYI